MTNSTLSPTKLVKTLELPSKKIGITWNKIERRMFSQISKNWRAKPLETLEVIVNLIVPTTTNSGLHIKCGIDFGTYETRIKVSDEELANINIVQK